jgi:DNA-binding MarR family transcriptional regulator
LDSRDIRHFKKELRRFERITALQLKNCCHGISMALCHALIEIDELKQTTGGRLARILNLDKSTLSRTVDKLHRLGLVERIQNPVDRRYTLIILTEEGKIFCRSINKSSDEFYIRAFEFIPKEKRKDIVESFAILCKALFDYEYYSKLEKHVCPSKENIDRSK